MIMCDTMTQTVQSQIKNNTVIKNSVGPFLPIVTIIVNRLDKQHAILVPTTGQENGGDTCIINKLVEYDQMKVL